MELEDAEQIIEDYAKKRIKEGEVKTVNVESSKLIGRGRKGKYPVWRMRGHATYKKKGILGGTGKMEFKAQINARNGKVLEFEEY